MESQNIKRDIVLLTEVSHIDVLESFLQQHPEIDQQTICRVALDREVELVLEDRHTPFVSGRGLRLPNTDTVVFGEQWTARILESARLSFFSYRGVTISQVYFLSFQSWLTRLLYYVDMVVSAVDQHPDVRRIIAFAPTAGGPSLGSILATHKVEAYVDAVQIVAKKYSIPVLLVPAPAREPIKNSPQLFYIKRALFSIVLSVLNCGVRITQRPRKIRILASDYWKNLAPYVQAIPSAEIVLVDRVEAFRAGPKNIWNYRMQFLHTTASAEDPTRAQTAERFLREWKAVKASHELDVFVFRGISLAPLLEAALDSLVPEVGTNLLRDIDDTHSFLSRVKPDIVILRSTVSTQTHFVVLAHVARAQGIPSIEMQHGLEYYGPGSVSLRHRAEFTGVYGKLTVEQMKAVKDTATTAVIVGSPRFDVYAASATKENFAQVPGAFNILCVAPAVDPGGDSPDTYDTEEYYAAVASAARSIPNVTVTVKFRPGPNRDSFVERTLETVFTGIPYTIAQFESFAELYPKADIVISCYSTALIEGLQCGKPLVYLGLSPAQSMMGRHHFTLYEAAGALRVATSSKELDECMAELGRDPGARERLSAGATSFLGQEYSFDGHSSERAASLVAELVERRRARRGVK